jgi:hypothetical protein
LKNSLGRGNLSPLVEDCSFFITVAVLESYKIFKGYFHKTLAQLSFNTATEKSVYTIIWRLPPKKNIKIVGLRNQPSTGNEPWGSSV